MPPTQEPASPVQPSVSSPEWFSPREVANAVRIRVRSVYKAIARGELKASMANGRDLRIANSWLREWMDKKAAR